MTEETQIMSISDFPPFAQHARILSNSPTSLIWLFLGKNPLPNLVEKVMKSTMGAISTLELKLIWGTQDDLYHPI
ncbi:hypothetical protein PIB30_078478 [Stylosanthes scabra]|uniref:Uncharacterized protein n=1 Tax=Stylosanthes scabra TaxID=79078 RepID=A0ABU6WP61_9FABA|nr:hypothetical protein [Stylosanthes scabra]